ncbi:MAG: U32 family peptidase, partial [Desulfonatronovibrionaceae bacterium]
LAREKNLDPAKHCLEVMGKIAPDGLIIADPGLLDMALRICPHIPVHLSTQANASNSAALHFWESAGVRRVNLAREMGLRDIRRCAENCGELELEVFVHGAMCMAVSGRCLMSAYLNKRSANLGLCTHPCRFDYRACLLLEEKKRPGQTTWTVEEDENFSRILASEDLCLIKYLSWLTKKEIHALKIEGRMKSIAYLAQVTDVYKTALRDLSRTNFRPHLYLEELKKTATRPLGSGFFLPRPKIFARPDSVESRGVLARITGQGSADSWPIQAKARWGEGTEAELLLPGLLRPSLGADTYRLEDENGRRVKTAHPGMNIFLRSGHPDLREGIILRKRHPEAK